MGISVFVFLSASVFISVLVTVFESARLKSHFPGARYRGDECALIVSPRDTSVYTHIPRIHL